MQKIFIYWFCVLQFCWNHWLFLKEFFCEIFRLPYIQDHVICNKINFTSSFPIWVPFISFPCLIAVARTSSPKLNRNSKQCREPAHETPPMTRSWGRKPDGQGASGFQGFRKAAPRDHLKDDLCLSDACYIRLLPNFCDTGRRPSLISFQIRINLEL